MKEIVIIGGGASGVMAAIWAAGPERRVTVLEQNERPLKKLLATGNGRCNFTNLSWDGDVLRGNAPQKALEIIRSFDHRQTMAFFRELGIMAKDRGGWVYPMNDSAAVFAKELLFEAEKRRIRFKNRETVTGIEKDADGRFQVKTQGWNYSADAVIVAVGSGASVKEEGFRLAEQTAKAFGMPYHAMHPALVPLFSSKKGIEKWAGVRTHGKISLYGDETKLGEQEGELQLTERGISGIPVFQLSRYAVQALAEEKQVRAVLNFLPDRSVDEAASYLKEQMEQGKSLAFAAAGLLPEKLAEVIAKQTKTPQDAAEKMHEFILPITGFGSLKTAQAAGGGVDLSVLTENLEAENCPGLYFVGEAVDVDGTCGGYNLQWAWSSGKAAGASCASKF